MDRSEQINELAAALAKAQGAIQAAAKSAVNPAFKSADKPNGTKYADLAAVWDACRAPLSANGLSVAQIPAVADGGRVSVTTVLLHASGQFLSATVSAMPAKADVQGLGSAITYLRRYGLSAMVGVAPDDDDGNAASERPAQAEARQTRAQAAPAGYDEWLAEVTKAAGGGMVSLRGAWQNASPEYRQYAGMAVQGMLKSKAAEADAQKGAAA